MQKESIEERSGMFVVVGGLKKNIIVTVYMRLGDEW
jgi:hypothetical protein